MREKVTCYAIVIDLRKCISVVILVHSCVEGRRDWEEEGRIRESVLRKLGIREGKAPSKMEFG